MGLMTDNSIVTSAYLSSLGFSYNSLFGYKRSGWIDEFGRGAYCKHGQNPPLEAALSALHLQLKKPVRIGGRSALAQRGFLHFVPSRETSATIYANRGVILPTWFKRKFSESVQLSATTVLPPSIGISEASVNGFQVLLSDPERAILELIEQVPRTVQLNECYQILDLMANLRSRLLNELLMHWTSVKIKRLFVLLAKDLNHQWFAKLDTQSFDLGSGCRVIDKDGSFNADFNVVVRPWREI